MRSLISTLLFAAILGAGCGRSGSPVASDADSGPEIVEDSSSDGSALTRTGIGYSPDPGSSYDSVHDGEKARATFSGGDGSSIKNAVVINASGEETGIRAAYIWSHEHYPNSRLLDEGVDYEGDRFYFEMKLATAGGKSHKIFFEITSFFGK